jgi:putative FmdB family regulatory protein
VKESLKSNMPLFEYRCGKCAAITEALIQRAESNGGNVTCAHCGSAAVTKLFSLVSFKVARRAKYSDEFLDKAKPFLQRQRATAQYFTEGHGSDDSKTFELAEQIGKRIDRTLASQLPTRKN